MKKKWSGVMVAIAILATGCRAAVPAVSETAAEESKAAVEEGWAILDESLEAARQEMESSLEEKEESLEAEKESIEDAKESLGAAEESLAAVEESLKEAEEAAGLEGRITYKQLTGSPATYQQKQVSFSGRVTRTARSGNSYGQLVVAVNGDQSQKLVCEYDRSKITPPLAVGDQVQVNGVFTGILQYRLDSGSSEDLPTMTVEEFGQIWRTAPETAAQPVESLPAPETWVDAESPAASTEGADAVIPDSTAVPPTESPFMGGPGMVSGL